jgi:hypothetical protein
VCLGRRSWCCPCTPSPISRTIRLPAECGKKIQILSYRCREEAKDGLSAALLFIYFSFHLGGIPKNSAIIWSRTPPAPVCLGRQSWCCPCTPSPIPRTIRLRAECCKKIQIRS